MIHLLYELFYVFDFIISINWQGLIIINCLIIELQHFKLFSVFCIFTRFRLEFLKNFLIFEISIANSFFEPNFKNIGRKADLL